MKFKKKEFLVVGEKTVEFSEFETKSAFAVRANKYGIRIIGESPMMEKEADLEKFAEAVANGFKAYRKLQYDATPKLVDAQGKQLSP